MGSNAFGFLLLTSLFMHHKMLVGAQLLEFHKFGQMGLKIAREFTNTGLCFQVK